MNRARVLLAVTCIGLFALSAWRGAAQREALTMVKLHDDLYVLKTKNEEKTFSGGNTAFYIGKDGVVVVDSKVNEDYGKEIVQKIKSVTDKPIKYLINTHFHGDHTHGNPAFPEATEIIAHELCKKRMLQFDADYWKGNRAKFVPKKLYTKTLSLFSGRDQIDLLYLGPAHTDGDTFVIFKRLKTAHLGDCFFNKWIPFIDTRARGTSLGYVKVLSQLAERKDIETFIAGHGEVQAKNLKDLQEAIQYHKDLQAEVKKFIAAGKSREETVKELRLPKYAKYSGYNERLGNNVGIVYDELKR